MTELRRILSNIRWYVREMVGETAYDRYLEHHTATQCAVPLMTRREFERFKTDRPVQPGNRCC